MAIYKDKNKTKDGRCWYFKVYKKDFNGVNKAYKSKRYLTKKEAQEEEALFLLKRDNPLRKPFSLIANDYFNHLKKVKKASTYDTRVRDYHNHIEPYLKDFEITSITTSVLNEWKSQIEKLGYSLNYCNKV